MVLKPRAEKAQEEPIDVREYAAVKGISRREAALELCLDTEEDEELKPGLGHNSGFTHADVQSAHGKDTDGAAAEHLTKAAKEKLKQTVMKIEKLEEERKEVAEQIRDVYAEAKSMGYDVKALRSLIRIRKMDRQEREEAQAILETYMLATGDLEFYD